MSQEKEEIAEEIVGKLLKSEQAAATAIIKLNRKRRVGDKASSDDSSDDDSNTNVKPAAKEKTDDDLPIAKRKKRRAVTKKRENTSDVGELMQKYISPSKGPSPKRRRTAVKKQPIDPYLASAGTSTGGATKHGRPRVRVKHTARKPHERLGWRGESFSPNESSSSDTSQRKTKGGKSPRFTSAAAQPPVEDEDDR